MSEDFKRLSEAWEAFERYVAETINPMAERIASAFESIIRSNKDDDR